jgi:hypothetical protein
MGWKTINGREYFYKSERVEGHFKTTYFRAGESAPYVGSWRFGTDRQSSRWQ